MYKNTLKQASEICTRPLSLYCLASVTANVFAWLEVLSSCAYGDNSVSSMRSQVEKLDFLQSVVVLSVHVQPCIFSFLFKNFSYRPATNMPYFSLSRRRHFLYYETNWFLTFCFFSAGSYNFVTRAATIVLCGRVISEQL